MIQITDSNYNQEINEGLVLVDFYGSWCVPCEHLSNTLEKFESEYPQIKFIKANIEENIQLRKQYRIMGLPTLLLLQDGERVELLSGLRDENELKNIFKKYI